MTARAPLRRCETKTDDSTDVAVDQVPRVRFSATWSVVNSRTVKILGSSLPAMQFVISDSALRSFVPTVVGP